LIAFSEPPSEATWLENAQARAATAKAGVWRGGVW
jgi:hypothetical protein